MLSVIIYFKCS